MLLATAKLNVSFLRLQFFSFLSSYTSTLFHFLIVMKMSEILTLPFSLCISLLLTVARYDHTTVVLSDGSVLVMGGHNGSSQKNDVWKTVNGGASWIMATSSAGWTGKNIIHLSKLAASPFLLGRRYL
jgi:hypothetical protein